MRSNSPLVPLLMLGFVLFLGRTGSAQFLTITRWVNAETGLDTNNGSLGAPWRTLTHALEVARLNPGTVKKIKIAYTARPIAPGPGSGACSVPHGCADDFGDVDLCGREPCGSFPFVVPSGVTVEGVPGPGS